MCEVLVAHPLRLTLQWQGALLVEIALDWAEGAVPGGGVGGVAASGECAEVGSVEAGAVKVRLLLELCLLNVGLV